MRGSASRFCLPGAESLRSFRKALPATCALALAGLPAGVELCRLLGEHHADPDRIQGSKFIALPPETGAGTWLMSLVLGDQVCKYVGVFVEGTV